MSCLYDLEMSLTVKLVPVEHFLVQNATTDTVQARWASVKGATGYRLTWASPGTPLMYDPVSLKWCTICAISLTKKFLLILVRFSSRIVLQMAM